MENGYTELELHSLDALAAASLPSIHKDPFDRILVAQANRRELTFLTSDDLVARYPGAIMKV